METLSETNSYKIKIENFEGPLDLLYHLVEKNKMNIYDISISDIADQYIEYINSMKAMNLEITGDFLIMASSLLFLKSKILLPTEEKEDEEEIDTKEDLIKKLVEYKRIKEITELMRDNDEKFSMFHYKEPEKITFPKIKPKLETTYSSDLIPSVFLKIAKTNMEKVNHNASDVHRLIESEKVTVKSKIRDILRGILKKGQLIFNKTFNTKEKSKIEVITAFMAMLELNRASKVSISQDYTFGDIKLTRRMD